MAGSNVNSVQARNLLKVSKQRVDALNRIIELEENHVLACKPSFNEDTDKTYCTLLNKRTKKRTVVCTSEIFEAATFNEDRSAHMWLLMKIMNV